MYLRIVIDHKLLDDVQWCILKLFRGSRHSLGNLLQEVCPDILVSVGLEDFSRYLTTFKALSMDKVAELISSAAIGSVIVATRHSPEIAWFDQLVHGGGDLLSSHLIELGHLDLLLLIVFLELDDGLVSEID